jgi:hypothetical protein
MGQAPKNMAMTQYKPAPTRAVAGTVSSQAVAMSWATPQRILFFLSASPTIFCLSYFHDDISNHVGGFITPVGSIAEMAVDLP